MIGDSLCEGLRAKARARARLRVGMNYRERPVLM